MSKRIDELTIGLHKEHLNGLMISELAKKYNVTWNCIYNRFKSRNLPIIKDLHRSIKYKKPFNESYFSNINTERKAYFLGLIYSDGYIRERNKGSFSLGLKLKTEDGYMVELLQSELNASCYKLQKSKNNKTGMIGIEVQSNTLVDDLISLGVKIHKSHQDLNIPQLDEGLIFHFLRGLIDGDGWICSSKKVQIGLACSSYSFLNEIKILLNNFDIKSTIYTKQYSLKNSKHNDLYTLYILGNKSKYLLLNKLYENSSIYLLRKYSKFIHANTVLSSKINNLEVA
jgi:intein/homing endonuclease